jgi:hypothetical protein
MDEFWEYGHDLEILNYDWVKRIEAGQDIAKMLARLHHSANSAIGGMQMARKRHTGPLKDSSVY